MSKIEYESKELDLFNCKKIFEDKIGIVCNKIGFDDSEVSWIIYNPYNKKYCGLTIGICDKHSIYGYCKPAENKIWISTLSIRSDLKSSLYDKLSQQLKPSPTKECDDFLANVIIDEITHIQTKCDHGSREYEAKFRKNKEKYYSSCDGRAVLKCNPQNLNHIFGDLIKFCVKQNKTLPIR